MVLAQKFLRSGVNLISAAKLINRSYVNNFKNYRYISLSSVQLADLLFTDKHEWVSVVGDVGIVGISNYAQESLGDIVYAQLPDIGTKLSLKDECGALESVKAASEIYSPISGVVTEKNTEVENSPAFINSSCYEKGWLFKVKLSDPKELEKLMNQKEYDAFLKTNEQ